MRFMIIFNIMLWFSGHFRVECVLDKIRNTMLEMLSSIWTPLPDAEYPSLVLAADKSKNCIIANVPIVSHRMGPNVEKYLFACPAESNRNEEIAKNEHESRTKNALFIREAYENPLNQEKGKKNKPPNVSEDNGKNSQFMEYGCENPVIPSIKNVGTVVDNGLKIEFHLVGFEIYMGEYESLKVEDYGKKFMKLNKGFAWFNLLIIRFDREGGNVLSVTCEMYNDRLNVKPPATEPAEKLEDNLFLDYFYGEKNYQIANTYEEGHQREVFVKLFLDTPLLEPYFDIRQQRHLSKAHLVPLDSFVHPILELSARTYGNIAPMWEKIRINSWSRVENYVRHLVQGVYGVLVITGTYGTLSLVSNKYDIYLEPNNANVKVPLAFWKIITYTKKAHQFYNILIVTENNSYEKATDVLCNKSQCAETGWEFIENDDISMGRTYCCIITNEILKKLQLLVSDSVRIDQVLNLKKVPHWEKEKLTLNLAEFIQDQMKQPPPDPTIRADNVKYRNEKGILLDSELQSKNNKEDEGISLTSIVTTIYKDYISPLVGYLPFFSNPKNDVRKN